MLATQNDPFRLDTLANHRDGEWLAITAREIGLGDRRFHLRGLHYAITMAPRPYIKPDGTPYENTDENWTWLSEDAGKAARFLGYIPFDQIIDKRNDQPEIREFSRPSPGAYLSTELHIDIPYDIEPTLYTDDFRGVQPYHLVLIGEKSSLAEVLGLVARAHEADVYLPTGEISDTQIYQMAKSATADSRPLVVLYFADCDPSGWQMGISVSRKLQAFKVLFPGMPDFEVHRAAPNDPCTVTRLAA